VTEQATQLAFDDVQQRPRCPYDTHTRTLWAKYKDFSMLKQVDLKVVGVL
jgi:hypothetical protein